MEWQSMIDDAALGGGNVPFWLRDRGDDLFTSRIWLDRPWEGPDGKTFTSLSLADILNGITWYRELYNALGVTSGDVVAIRISSPIAVYLNWMALAASGAIGALVNPNVPQETLKRYASQIHAVGILTDSLEGSRQSSFSWSRRSDGAFPAWFEVAMPSGATTVYPEHPHSADDIILLCHTSGTTGLPKAVPSSHRGLLAGIRNQLHRPASPLVGSTVLNILPIAHHSWLSTITWALLTGTQLILASDQSAETLVACVERFKPDSIRSFACTLRGVARLNLPPGALASVALWMTTGDASRRHDIAEVSALGTHPVLTDGSLHRIPGMFVLDGLGSTELGHWHFSLLHRPGKLEEPRCVGRPVSFASAAILDENGNELPDNTIGYLAVRSDAVTPGYWMDPERTRNSRRGNFWITGDVAYRDRFGRYFHIDRLTDVINTSDQTIGSLACEEGLLLSLPKIERCAIVMRNADDAASSRAVCLIESPDTERDRETWRREINDVLARISPGLVVDVMVYPPGTLPVGPTGKVRKFVARSQLSDAS